MAKPLRPKRGTTAKNDAFTGLASEITIDTDKHSIRVHDGVTAGGHEILPKAKNDELYAPKDLDVGVTSVNGQTGDVSVDVGVTSVNGNTGDITPEQTGCLPLSGGTMTSAIHFDGIVAASRTTDNSYAQFNGGTEWGRGASLELFGCYSNDGGIFRISSSDGNEQSILEGMSNGGLTWKGKNIVRSVNGVDADTNGNAAIPSYPRVIVGQSKSSFTLPSGGTWTYCIVGYTAGSNFYNTGASGTAAGGTNVSHPCSGNSFYIAIRVA